MDLIGDFVRAKKRVKQWNNRRSTDIHKQRITNEESMEWFKSELEGALVK